MDDEIDLRDIIRVLWKRRLLIIGVFVVAVLVAGVISFTMQPVYRASTIIAVGNFKDPVYTSQISVKVIMLSDEFLQDVFGPLSPNATESEFVAFKDSVKVELVKGSGELIEISVETPNRQESKEKVEKIIGLYANRSENSYNTYKKILSDQLAVTQEHLDFLEMEINQTLESLTGIKDSSGLSEELVEMRFSRTLECLSGMETRRSALINHGLDLQKQILLIKNLEVVQPVREPIDPIGPRKALIVAIAGMLGLIVGIFVAFLKEGLGRAAE